MMLITRLFFFRLLESPEFLISHNRKQEAMFVFQEIARINGCELEIHLDDLSSTDHVSSTHSLLSSDVNRGHKFHNIKSISTHFRQKFGPTLNDLEHLFSK